MITILTDSNEIAVVVCGDCVKGAYVMAQLKNGQICRVIVAIIL
jgi:hypothetical protein